MYAFSSFLAFGFQPIFETGGVSVRGRGLSLVRHTILLTIT